MQRQRQQQQPVSLACVVPRVVRDSPYFVEAMRRRQLALLASPSSSLQVQRDAATVRPCDWPRDTPKEIVAVYEEHLARIAESEAAATATSDGIAAAFDPWL